jgi:hypothetical protein
MEFRIRIEQAFGLDGGLGYPAYRVFMRLFGHFNEKIRFSTA